MRDKMLKLGHLRRSKPPTHSPEERILSVFSSGCCLFMIVEKTRPRGERVKRCRCCERQNLMSEDVKASNTLGGTGEGVTEGGGNREEARGLLVGEG
jgi:hypothetical protein